jgi:hypothetical protein
MSGSVQELMQQAREMLAAQGAVPNAENLNRAMLMLTGSGDVRTEQTAEGFDMNAQVDRMIDRSTPRRANVPRNAQPSAAVGASDTAPVENAAVGDPTLPMPPPDVATAAEQTGQRRTIVPGEGMIYTAPVATPSSLDGNGMTARLLRDLVMGAEAAGAVTGMLPTMRGGAAATRATPTSAAVPNSVTTVNGVRTTPEAMAANLPASATTRTMAPPPPMPPAPGPVPASVQSAAMTPPPLPASMLRGISPGQTPPLTPQQVAELSARNPRVAAGFAEARRVPGASAELSPTMQRALAGPDLPPGLPTGLSPMQRATLMGPGPAADAAVAAARTRAGTTPKPRNMSAAQRQRRQNIAESQ